MLLLIRIIDYIPEAMTKQIQTKNLSDKKYLIGRQPILDRHEQVFAYELLFRTAATKNTADVNNASHATASVILNTLSYFGTKQILGSHLGFINFEGEILMSDSLELLPRDTIVLELLETLEVTPELVERCQHLKEAGFILALDDHVYDPIYEDLYQIIDIIKVDLMVTPVDTLAPVVAHYRKFPLKLLAEKVETREEFRQCVELGFDYFQGYYFAKPSIMEKRKINEGGAALLKLMRQLSDDVEIDEIEKTFRQSPGLTYKLLLLVNSVAFASLQKIQSVRHAITMLGRSQMKRWVQLTLFAADSDDVTSNPLLDMAAVRAGLMEEIACTCPALRNIHDAPEQAFMTGILSLLEVLYDIPMQQVANELNLSEEVQLALLERGGIYGTLLSLAQALEQFDFEAATPLMEQLAIDHATVTEAQLKAFSWQTCPI